MINSALYCRCPGAWNPTCHQHETAEAFYLLGLQQWKVRGVTSGASACKGESRLGRVVRVRRRGLDWISCPQRHCVEESTAIGGVLGSRKFRKHSVFRTLSPLEKLMLKALGSPCHKGLFCFIHFFWGMLADVHTSSVERQGFRKRAAQCDDFGERIPSKAPAISLECIFCSECPWKNGQQLSLGWVFSWQSCQAKGQANARLKWCSGEVQGQFSIPLREYWDWLTVPLCVKARAPWQDKERHWVPMGRGLDVFILLLEKSS